MGSVQFSSVAEACLTLCKAMDCNTPGHPVHHQLPQSLLKLISVESVIPSNHLILCHPFLLPLSIFPNIRVFSNESALHMRWPKYWSFSISPFNMAQNHFPVSTHISAYMCRACKTWKVLKIKKSRFHLFSRTSSIIDSGFLC